MKPIAVLLGDGWADWEAGYLVGAAGYFLGSAARVFTPNGQPVRSTGGIQTIADGGFRDLTPAEYSAIALIGGPLWLAPDPVAAEVVARAATAGVAIGGICSGTLPLARAGLLDDRRHTSNGPGYLAHAAAGYRGQAHYQDTPRAVADRRVATAPGTASCTFAVALLRLAAPKAGSILDSLQAHSAAEHAPT